MINVPLSVISGMLAKKIPLAIPLLLFLLSLTSPVSLLTNESSTYKAFSYVLPSLRHDSSSRSGFAKLIPLNLISYLLFFACLIGKY